jgi:D-threo-aldose 1-dehydrogenase
MRQTLKIQDMNNHRYRTLEKTNTNVINLPKIILGTSCLGNLYVALPYETKLAIISEYVRFSRASGPVFFDTAGKYGAGLALECLGECLTDLKIKPAEVCISNKLGWLRVPLIGTEPTFEPGVWKELKYDAVQKISYEGILACYEQGNKLLKNYRSTFTSVHDPDEYLDAAVDRADEKKRYQDILDAYAALQELKVAGKVQAIGVGAKNWRVIERICKDIKLDWIMIANSMTVHSHPENLINFMKKMEQQGIQIINSAVFNAGFLTGGSHYNYAQIDPDTENGRKLYDWRERFFKACALYRLSPASVCVQFGRSAPGVSSVALSTSSPDRISSNMNLTRTQIPEDFWHHLHSEELISSEGLDLLLKTAKI